MTRRLMRLATFCGVALLLSGFAAQADAGLLDLFGGDGCCRPKKAKKHRCCAPAPPTCCAPAPPACCRPAPPPVCVQPAPVCCQPAPVCARPAPACCAPHYYGPGDYAPGGAPPPAGGEAAPAPPAEEAAPAPEA